MTMNFPEKETFGLTSQIRRAAVSIPSNIAEGQGRHSSKEFRQFLGIALGSIAELETQIIISREIHYINEEELNLILIKTDGIRKMLRSLINSLK